MSCWPKACDQFESKPVNDYHAADCAELRKETMVPWINGGKTSENLVGRGGRPKDEALGEAPPAYRLQAKGAVVGAESDNKKERWEDNRQQCSCSHMV